MSLPNIWPTEGKVIYKGEPIFSVQLTPNKDAYIGTIPQEFFEKHGEGPFQSQLADHPTEAVLADDGDTVAWKILSVRFDLVRTDDLPPHGAEIDEFQLPLYLEEF